MTLRSLSFQICAAAALFAGPLRFSAADALQAEWRRQAPSLTPEQIKSLPEVDRFRFERTLKRIAQPGAAPILAPEWEKPTREAWEAKLGALVTPRDRFDALTFLNRFKSPRALESLAGLKAADARRWPRHLHLEAGIASARLNGSTVTPELDTFLGGLQKAGKVDPVRAQAARLRLVMAGKESTLLPPVKATPGSILALMDAWNRNPWEKRKALALEGFRTLDPASPAWAALGLERPTPEVLQASCTGILSRLAEGTPRPAPAELLTRTDAPWACATSPLATFYALQALERFEAIPAATLNALQADFQSKPLHLQGAFLPVLRKHDAPAADALRAKLLAGEDVNARASAISDLAQAPADLDALVQRLWKVEEYDGIQALLGALPGWKLPETREKALLTKLLEHPCWTARQDAWQRLVKRDPATPWPAAPAPSATDEAILKEAGRLGKAMKPVKLRLTFSGKRVVTLKLDPVNAPMNVANLVLLARKGYFNGLVVPRIVPDFVVQVGSPLDTMDGGPGYTLRCENSTGWYGPGTVGMALSGKDTGGSQFFITTNATPHLTGKYTRLGDVMDPDRALPLLDALELGAKLERVDVLE